MLDAIGVVFREYAMKRTVFLADRVVVMTPRPGQVAHAFDVPLPRPRTVATRAQPDFGALAIHESLMSARQ